MADTTYTSNQELPENIAGFEQYQSHDTSIITSFQVNKLFDPTKNYVELHILDLADSLLESNYTYNRYSLLGNAQSTGNEGASILTIDPIQDSLFYGFSFGGVKLLYHFLNDLYTTDNTTSDFYIDSISADRTELSLLTHTITPENLVKFTDAIKTKLQSQSYFNEIRLDFKNNNLLIGVNIDTLDTSNGKSVVIKLYEPLPATFTTKSTLNIVEVLSDSVAYEVDYELATVPETFTNLRSANFDIEVQDHSVIPTRYFDYSELLSYNTSNSNSEIYSMINEKGVELSIDYTDYSNFIHFSSAQERLLNFKYKIDLLNSYSQSLSTISTTTGLVSGSTTYYQNLYQGIINNFDHYERFLYYESGSSSWPKVNNTKPYVNQTSTQALSWFNSALTNSVGYDNSNYSALVDTIPSYLREDENNANYLTFVYMVGQHFDNLWIYSKAVTDRYDGDNRINHGISKDLVGEALKSFGVNLYTSNKSIKDLFTTFIGQAYQSGSEVINHYITGSLTGSNTPIQPTSYNNYQKEVQKRIYHNIPLLLKSKGTERGVRALINCFGIPSDILQIKLYGGNNQESLPYFGEQEYNTGSLGKIRLDNTGSLVSGSTLSSYTSIIKRDDKYTDDIPTIEIGFSPTDNIDKYIISQSVSTFDIDDYLGDAINLTSSSYAGLYNQAYSLLGNLDTYDVRDYVRLIKFFDNTVFKMIKDFVPARSVDVTGIIIKPNLLNISKAKSVSVSATQPEYTASIDTAFISGSHGYSYIQSIGESSTAYTDVVQTPQGLAINTANHRKDEAKYNGELSGSQYIVSNRDLNRSNLLKYQNLSAINESISFITDIPLNVCSIVSQSAQPKLITMPGTYNIANDLVTAFYSGVSYTSSPYLPITIGGVGTFSNVNYTTYRVTASRDSLLGCSGSISYLTQYCEIGATGPVAYVSPMYSGSFYNVTSWFASGSNNSSSFWISDYATPTVSSSFNSSSFAAGLSPFTVGTTVIIALKDNLITTCNASISIPIVAAPTSTITFSNGTSIQSSTKNSISVNSAIPSIGTYGTITVTGASKTIYVEASSTTANDGTATLYLQQPAGTYLTSLTISEYSGITQDSTTYVLAPGTYYYNLSAYLVMGPGNVTATIKII